MLIGFLAPSHPEIAAEAGRRPLNSASQSEASSLDQEMDDREDVPTTVTSVQAADAALRLLDADEAPIEVHASTTNGTFGQTRLSPTSNNVDSRTVKHHGHKSSVGKTFNSGSADESGMALDAQDSDAAVDGLLRLKDSSPKSGQPPSRMRSASNGFGSNGSLATSPNLRQYPISAREGSPVELPAMQTSPSQSNSAKSPNGERNLPSLVSHFGSLAEAPSKDQEVRTNGIPNHGRHSFSSASGGPGHSPPMSSSTQDRRLPGQFITTQQRQPLSYQAQYPPSQTSPDSTYSETSPRQIFSQGQDQSSMSPPKQGYHPYYANRRASHNDEHGPPYPPPGTGESKYTPTSADGNPSSDGYTPTTDATPNDHRMSVEGIPPSSEHPASHPNGPLVTGGFKCDFPGCPAAPFQTQYLLKSVPKILRKRHMC